MLPYPNDAPPQVLEFAPNELISLSIAVKLVFPKKLIGSWQGALDMPIRTRAALGPRSTGKKTGLHGACLTKGNARRAGVLIAAIEIWGHD
jgi:hypothetical protein